MNTVTFGATVEARALPGCTHLPRFHRTVAELLLCVAPHSRWVRDEKRELEFPEMHKIAVIWCEAAGFSLYPDRHRALSAIRQASFRLCPAGYSCDPPRVHPDLDGPVLASAIDQVLVAHDVGVPRTARPPRSVVISVNSRIPNSTAQSTYSGEWVVASYCSDVIFGGPGPEFLMFPTFASAARAYDNANVWSCYAEKCRGLHSIRLVIPS